ncbi:hypothetical protein OG497_38070 [Streptomyces sp. NBC_01242]|uniref:hypothetical protein n=1 Tax=Streptomyces sp. NBC_01242 TaxID=2903795 RepID=UPI00225708F1|nr:hypothetical protein [Streptomyces sp. NBC_01242]MCX4799667.1 hypothetical protein [Streptomyces sp. NBC_01242]
MSAAKRRATPVDALVEPDLTDVPMTPMMEAMRTAGLAVRDAQSALSILDSLVLDTSEGAWAEGQLVKDMLKVQGRKYTDRTVFGKRLQKRDIDTGESWRNRTCGPLDEQPVPDYLNDLDLARAADLVEELAAVLARINTKRDEQYPRLHKRSMKAINARMPGMAS